MQYIKNYLLFALLNYNFNTFNSMISENDESYSISDHSSNDSKNSKNPKKTHKIEKKPKKPKLSKIVTFNKKKIATIEQLIFTHIKTADEQTRSNKIKEAIKNYTEALNCHNTLDLEKSINYVPKYHIIGKLYFNLAENYSKLNNLPESIKYFDAFLQYLDKYLNKYLEENPNAEFRDNYHKYKILALLFLVKNNFELKNFQESIKYSDKFLKYLDELSINNKNAELVKDSNQYKKEILFYFVQNHFYLNQYQESLGYSKTLLESLDLSMENNENQNLEYIKYKQETLLLMMRSCFHLNLSEESVFYAEKLLTFSTKLINNNKNSTLIENYFFYILKALAFLNKNYVTLDCNKSIYFGNKLLKTTKELINKYPNSQYLKFYTKYKSIAYHNLEQIYSYADLSKLGLDENINLLKILDENPNLTLNSNLLKVYKNTINNIVDYIHQSNTTMNKFKKKLENNQTRIHWFNKFLNHLNKFIINNPHSELTEKYKKEVIKVNHNLKNTFIKIIRYYKDSKKDKEFVIWNKKLLNFLTDCIKHNPESELNFEYQNDISKIHESLRNTYSINSQLNNELPHLNNRTLKKWRNEFSEYIQNFINNNLDSKLTQEYEKDLQKLQKFNISKKKNQ